MNPASLNTDCPYEVPPQYLNDYQQAILAVMQILENYDSDKMIGTFGFGAYTNYPQGPYAVTNFPLKFSILV
jgi:hypothetical protein